MMKEVSLESQIMTLLANSNKLSRREIEMETGYKKTSVYEALQYLIGKGHIEQVGSSISP
jgi:predicted transcriptional regulator